MEKQKTTHKGILITSIILTVSYLFYLFNKKFLTLQLLKDYEIWNITTLEYFIPIILLPIGIFLLYRYKKTGWIITSSLLMYFLTIAIYLMSIELKLGVFKNSIENHNMIFNNFHSGKGATLYIIQILVLLLILTFLNLKKVKNIYDINNKIQIATLLFPIIIAILYASIY